MRYILASKSPRRKEILQMLGLSFEVVTADTDESSEERDPTALVRELSRRKGEAVRELLRTRGEDLDNTVIISSDTVVAAEGEILGKPRDEEEACRMLRLYVGRTHRVVSGICLIRGDRCAVSHEVTEVVFDDMTEEEIRTYVKEQKPYDKAGAYAIQGVASAYIKEIRGDYFNVVGLPVHGLCKLYRENFGENIL